MTDAGAEEAAVWNESRRQLHALIRGKSPRLAGVYRSAIRLLDSQAPEGEQLARVVAICHDIRELMNRIGPLVSEEDLEPRRGKDSSTLARELLDVAETLGDYYAPAEGEYVVVPAPIAAQVHELIDALRAETQRIDANATRLLTKTNEGRVPAVAQWLSARRFFTGHAHVRDLGDPRTETAALPSDDELCKRLEVVEDLVRGMFVGFVANHHEVDAILAAANGSYDEVADA